LIEGTEIITLLLFC